VCSHYNFIGFLFNNQVAALMVDHYGDEDFAETLQRVAI
jgi:hypothetical protein